MDDDNETAQNVKLDQLMMRAYASIQESLDSRIDVKQRLSELFREAGVDPDLVQAERPTPTSR